MALEGFTIGGATSTQNVQTPTATSQNSAVLKGFSIGDQTQVPSIKNDPATTLRDSTFDWMPFSDDAKNILKGVNVAIDENIGNKEGVGSALGVTYGGFAHRLSRDEPINIYIKNSDDKKSLSHEYYYALFSNSDINPLEFNKAWDKAKLGSANSNNELGAFDDWLNNKVNGTAYKNTKTDQYALATERFAYLGTIYGQSGISEFPSEMMEYYKPYLNNIPKKQLMDPGPLGTLPSDYKSLSDLYTSRRVVFDTMSANFQAQEEEYKKAVNNYNKNGGDLDTYTRLNLLATELNKQAESLKRQQDDLNSIVDPLNDASKKDAIDKYVAAGGTVIGKPSGNTISAEEKQKIEDAKLPFYTRAIDSVLDFLGIGASPTKFVQQNHNTGVAKIPFSNRLINVLPNDLTGSGTGQQLAGFIEWPERIVTGIQGMAKSIASGGKGDVSSGDNNPFHAQPTNFVEDTKLMTESLIDKGWSPTGAVLLSSIVGTLTGAMELLPVAGFTKSLLGKVASKSALTTTEHIALWEQFGSPKTMAEAKTIKRGMLIDLGNQSKGLSTPEAAKAAAKINASFDVLEKLGIPKNTPVFVKAANDLNTLLDTDVKNLADFTRPSKLKTYTPPPAQIKGLIPDKTGKVTPEPLGASGKPVSEMTEAEIEQHVRQSMEAYQADIAPKETKPAVIEPKPQTTQKIINPKSTLGEAKTYTPEELETTRGLNKRREEATVHAIGSQLQPGDISAVSEKFGIDKEEAKKIISDTTRGRGPQPKITETGKGIANHRSFSIDYSKPTAVPEKYSAFATSIDKIKGGNVSNVHERYVVGNLPKEFSEHGRTEIRATYDAVKHVVDMHGSFPTSEFIQTINEPDGVVAFPMDKNGIERINVLKQIAGKTYLAGAIRVNGYNLTTYFEPAPENEKSLQKYLNYLKGKGGILAYRSGGTSPHYLSGFEPKSESAVNPKSVTKGSERSLNKKLSNPEQKVKTEIVDSKKELDLSHKSVEELKKLYEKSEITKEQYDGFTRRKGGSQEETHRGREYHGEEQREERQGGQVPEVKSSIPKNANIGDFADGTPIVAGHLEDVKPIELPEMVQLAKDLMGQVPQVREKVSRMMGGSARGVFIAHGNGKIKLRADLFDPKKNDVTQVAKTLAHEIGHLTDYLPDRVSNRGNLLGRLYTLKNFRSLVLGPGEEKVDVKALHNRAFNEVLKESGWTMSDYMQSKKVREDLAPKIKEKYISLVEKSGINNNTLKSELTKVSEYWRPYDKKASPENYIAYRNSPSELYADAISMLFNSPGLLEKMAPTFYKEFFNALDRKPDVRDAYFAIQSTLSGDRDVLISARRQGINQMFKEGDYKAIELQNSRIAEAKSRFKDYISMFKFDLIDRNYPMLERISALEKSGVKISMDDNPRYYLEERNYLGGKIKAIIEGDFNPIYQELNKAEVPWTNFGEALFYERIIAGDRSSQANPRGITPESAKELNDSLRNGLTTEQKTVLDKSISDFRQAVRKISEEAYQEGLYTDELYKQMQDNPAYVSFQVIDHIEDGMSSKVYKSIGTLKDIVNPADSTILKIIATVRAIERNKVNRVSVDFLTKNYKGEIAEAKKMFTGKAMRFMESKDPKEELITFMRKGKQEGYYVDPYIAHSLRNDSIGQNKAVMAVLSPFSLLNSKVFRPAFIGLNFGFQSFNLIRDFKRFWKNQPDMTFMRSFKRYLEAGTMSKIRGFGLPEKATIKQIEAFKALQELEYSQTFSTTFTDLVSGHVGEDKQIDHILQKSGIESFVGKKYQGMMKPIMKTLDFIENMGQTIETLPKAAAYYEIASKRGLGGKLTAEDRSFIRKYVGSPDFLAGGYLKKATNELFLFSNAITQGIRSDLELASGPKTRGSYWWKTAKLNILPKMLMFGAGLGLFGPTVKKIIDDASEYDRTNYTLVPIGIDKNSNKSIYLRIPEDEMGRLFGGVVWKGLMTLSGKNEKSFIQNIQDVASLMGGQIPSISPAITTPNAWTQFMAGQNPYDFFRGRNLLSDDVYKAGGEAAWSDMLKWTWNQLGGGVFYQFNVGNQSLSKQSTAEKVLNLPVVSNALGRFIKITNYGETEVLKNVVTPIQSQAAKDRLAEKDIVNTYLDKAQDIKDLTDKAKSDLVDDMVKEYLGGHLPVTDEEKKTGNRLNARFEVGLLRGENDPYVDALLSAVSTDEKVAILSHALKDMGLEEFKKFGNELIDSGVTSNDVVNAFKQGPLKAYEDGSETTSGGIIDTVLLYAKAAGTDPATTFNRIFTGQRIVRVTNGTVIVKSNTFANNVRGQIQKEKRLSNAEMGNLILDHVLSLELGGANSRDNLQLIETTKSKDDDRVENYLGDALNSGKINKAQAQEYMIRFKAGQGESLTQHWMDIYEKEYGSKPMTLDEITSLINKR